MSEPAKCRECGADVVWVMLMEHEPRIRVPVDAASIERRIVINGRRTRGAYRDTGVSHFTTCKGHG